MLLTTILAYAHIFSAMGWLAGGFLFSFFIASRLPSLSPEALRQFLLKIQPGVIRFFQAIAGLTIVTGILLYAAMYNLDNGPNWRTFLAIGIGFAVLAFLVSEFLAVPAFQKLGRIARSMPEGATSLPPEFPPAAKRAGMMGLVPFFLLLVTLAFMAAAGFY